MALLRSNDLSTSRVVAISLRGVPMAKVLVRRELIGNPGEASILVDETRPRFGSAAVVLRDEDDDGSVDYLGGPALVELLVGVPVERMPWSIYPLR